MNYWLIKSEPSVWSFNDQKKAGSKGTIWDGVRNYQAANYLKQMKLEDHCFFYHSNEDKKIIGIVKVIKTAFIDPTDKEKKFVAVKVAYHKDFIEPVSLMEIKENKEISHLPL
ncbi:MAG: EVE domain-containing protein, partial [Pelagibacterales bacterium]|nr:EVE domain-containing protein [Pelagibacterales bacterium]